ncbi:hypothetical protein ACFQV4_19525 [Streptomyces thermocarboxydus]
MADTELITPVAGEPGDYNIPVIQEFRSNGGKVGGMFEGVPSCCSPTEARRAAVRGSAR